MVKIKNRNEKVIVIGDLTGLASSQLKKAIQIALQEKKVPVVDITKAHPIGFMALHMLRDFYGMIMINAPDRPELNVLTDVLEMQDMIIGENNERTRSSCTC